MRKLPRGILGIKCPLLSSTDTSMLTRLTSLLKLGTDSGTSGWAFLLSFDGIGTSSGSLDGCRGLATVGPTSLVGPLWSCAIEATPDARKTASTAVQSVN